MPRVFVAAGAAHATKPVGRPYASVFRQKLFVYGDASGAHLQTTGGRSDYSIIREFFRNLPGFDMRLIVPAANPPVRDRVNALNARLTNARGERHLYVNPGCTELIADLEQVAYKPGSSQLDKDRDSARTHASDALGYYVWQDFRLVERIGEKSRRFAVENAIECFAAKCLTSSQFRLLRFKRTLQPVNPPEGIVYSTPAIRGGICRRWRDLFR